MALLPVTFDTPKSLSNIKKIILHREQQFTILGQSQPTAGKAQTGLSGQNTVLGCSQRLASRLRRSAWLVVGEGGRAEINKNVTNTHFSSLMGVLTDWGGDLLRAVPWLTLRWKLQILPYFYSFQSFQSIFGLYMMKQYVVKLRKLFSQFYTGFCVFDVTPW